MKVLIYLLVAITLLLTGCTFQVKNTDGLRLAYEDIDLATSKGLELKALKNVDKQLRQQAIGMYQDAKATINGYLKQAITDAAGYTVDKPAESYIATKAHEKVSSFQAKVDKLSVKFRIQAFPGVMEGVAVIVIKAILEQHDQNQKAAYGRFKETVEKYMMKNYVEL